MKTKIAAWSSRCSNCLARPRGSAWYSAEAPYSSIAVSENTTAPTSELCTPCRPENTTRIGSEATASRKPRPWLMALTISSPRVCGRSAGAAAAARVGRTISAPP